MIKLYGFQGIFLSLTKAIGRMTKFNESIFHFFG